MRTPPALPRCLPEVRRGLIGAVLCAMAALAAAQELVPLSDTSLDAGELFERVSPSIWMVLTADEQGRGVASGSAVVVAPETLVTNCHVLERPPGSMCRARPCATPRGPVRSISRTTFACSSCRA